MTDDNRDIYQPITRTEAEKREARRKFAKLRDTLN